MVGLITVFTIRRTATRRAAMEMASLASAIRSAMTRKTKTMTSERSCKSVRSRANTLLISEVMFLWITEVSAFR